MNPPEKIFVHKSKGCLPSTEWHDEWRDEDDIEYHLAPAWHDAKEPCIWSGGSDEDYDVWETSCEQSFILIEGTPKDNDMKFCTYCGRVIETRLTSDVKESVVDMAGYLPSDDEIHDAGFTLDEII